MMRLRQIALSAVVSASIVGSLFCVEQLAAPDAQACVPWDGSCGNVDPHGTPDCAGCQPWQWGAYYGPGWYGGRYWHGGPWYGW